MRAIRMPSSSITVRRTLIGRLVLLVIIAGSVAKIG